MTLWIFCEINKLITKMLGMTKSIQMTIFFQKIFTDFFHLNMSLFESIFKRSNKMYLFSLFKWQIYWLLVTKSIKILCLFVFV